MDMPSGELRLATLCAVVLIANGVQRITSSLPVLSPEEERKYARLLLPPAGRPHRPTIDRDDGGDNSESNDDITTAMPPKPFEGVHFGPQCGGGPSGDRPEHTRDMLSCSRRRSANRLLRAIANTEHLAITGKLPKCWRWILRTRLVYIGKKHSTKPRPVRVGEFWRRVIAKHSLHKHLKKIRQLMLAARQFGVAIPGGSEILIHARNTIEQAIQEDPAAGVWASIDVDLVNCYPCLEWDVLR